MPVASEAMSGEVMGESLGAERGLTHTIARAAIPLPKTQSIKSLVIRHE
jgi:hypothetical protein